MKQGSIYIQLCISFKFCTFALDKQLTQCKALSKSALQAKAEKEKRISKSVFLIYGSAFSFSNYPFYKHINQKNTAIETQQIQKFQPASFIHSFFHFLYFL